MRFHARFNAASRRDFLQRCGTMLPVALAVPFAGSAHAAGVVAPTRDAQADRRTIPPAPATARLAATQGTLQAYQLGPSGGRGGGWFFDGFPGTGLNITRIIVRHGALVDALSVFVDGYPDPWGGRHGGGGGGADEFRLSPDEYLTSVWGQCGPLDDQGFYVTAINFATSNGSTYGPYGRGGGIDFVYYAPAGYDISSFWGRSGAWLDALGVYIRQRP